jgi:hypothetical protein
MSFLGEPDLVTDFPLHCEIKYQERLNIFAAIAQADKYLVDKKLDKGYCVIFRKNGGEWHIAMPFNVLMNLMKHEQTN